MPPTPLYQEPYQTALKRLNTHSEAGLSAAEVLKRQNKYGPNEIAEDKPKHVALKIFWHQLNNLLVYVLVAAAIITYFLDHRIDTYVIAAVLILNTLIGFIQEFKANKAIEALKEIVVSTSKVYRDGELIEIPSHELVPGDIILLEEGDRVPADGRLIEAKNLRTIESSLTGEAFPVEKNIRTISHKVTLGDRKNFVWMSTFVAGGIGKFIVTSTGSKTAIGKIAQSLAKIKKEKSHFEVKTARLTKQMSIIAISGALITFLVGFFIRDFTFAEIFTFAVASLVSGIPEGLPAVLVIILATGANRMAKKNAIIRSLPATETLSIVDVIATDKTGTLTQNTMTVEQINLVDHVFQVEGNGWIPQGNILENKKVIHPKDNETLSRLITTAGLCSRARLINKGTETSPNYSVSGDPTEGALTVLAYKASYKSRLESIKIIDELPFNQEAKFKAVMAQEENKRFIHASGAPESIIKLSSKLQKNGKVESFSQEEKQEFLDQVKKASSQAMRTIGLAYKPSEKDRRNLSHEAVNELIFLGFVSMIDPPRKGAAEAVLKARKAGIRVIMKTGDHKETALAIAQQSNIIDQNTKPNKFPLSLTGEELEKLSSDEFKQAINEVNVFSRLTPDMKLKILSGLQDQGHNVAMTGDGVNDVLALKKANIGIAMGNIGTDVAREASDIVLADDNFASLIDAVEEGRIVFDNTRQASAFLVTTNFAEDIIIISSVIMGLPLPLLASQILWLNLVTDGVVDIALAAEPGHGDVLDHPPRTTEENILSKKMISFLAPITVLMVLLSMWIFITYLPQGLDKARTGAFCAMCFTQLVNIFNMRSLNLSLFKIGILTNKYIVAAVLFSLFLQYIVMSHPFFMDIFRFAPLSTWEVIKIALLSSLVLWIGEAHKLARKKEYL